MRVVRGWSRFSVFPATLKIRTPDRRPCGLVSMWPVISTKKRFTIPSAVWASKAAAYRFSSKSSTGFSRQVIKSEPRARFLLFQNLRDRFRHESRARLDGRNACARSCPLRGIDPTCGAEFSHQWTRSAVGLRPRATALVKLACAKANEKLGLLSPGKKRGDSNRDPGNPLADHQWRDQFPVDVFLNRFRHVDEYEL